MVQDIPPEGTTGVAPDGTRVIVRNGQIVPLDAPAPTGPEAAGFVSLGGGWYRGPDGASYQQGRGGAMVKRSSAPEGEGDDDTSLRAAADLRGRLVLSLGSTGEAHQQMVDSVEGGYDFSKDWGARTADALPLVGNVAARVWGGEDYQELETASRSFESAMLPVFSGAAVTDSEARRFISANLPALGDSPTTLARKARNRALMLNGAATLLGQDLPYPELGVFGGLFKKDATEVPVGAVVDDVQRIGLHGGNLPAPPPDAGPRSGPSGGPAGGGNAGTGNERRSSRFIGLTEAGRPILDNGFLEPGPAVRALADSVFDSPEIVERDGKPFYAVGLQPGQGAPANLQTRFGQDGEISAEEMLSAGYVPDEESGKWLFPVDMRPLNEGVGTGGAAPRQGFGGDRVAEGGIAGLITGNTGGGSDPYFGVQEGGSQFQRQREEAERREREGRPLPLRLLSRGWDDFEAFAQSATEQIPYLDEAAAWTAAKLSGVSYDDARNVQRDYIEYDNANNRGERIAGGVAGAAATVATPLGAPLRVTKGASLGGRVLNRAAGGAAGGAVYGHAADDGNAFERLDGAAGGAALGAPAGVAAPWIAGRANAFGEVVSDGGRWAARNLGNLGVERGLPGAQRLVVAGAPRVTPLERGVQKFAERSPQQADAMLANVNALSGETINPTFADAVNDGGRGMLGALATRQTPGRDAARQFADGRAVDIQDRISRQARRTISDDPRSPDEIREAALREAQNAARPLYAQAYERPIEVTPAVEDILRRPVGRQAMTRARELAANEGRNPDELRLTALEDWGLPTGGGSAVPRAPTDPNLAADLRALRDGVGDRRAGQGKSLMEFVADNGGIRDEWDELGALGADGWSRQAPWRRRILQEGGADLETMAQRALEAGYFDDLARPGMEGADNMSAVGRDDLLEAFRREMAGSPRFAREANPADALRAGRRGALEERLGREGLDPRNTSPRDAARAFDEADDFEARMAAHLEGSPPGPPPVDIVRDSQPTMETLDYVKRAIDDVIESQRDPVTGKLPNTDDMRAMVAARAQYRAELVRLNPTYGDALAAYEGPIRLQRAADIGEGVLSTESDRFGAGIDSLRNPRELEVARAGARRAIERAAGTQGQAPGVAARLSTGREMRPRLEALVGPEGADNVQRAMAAELTALRNAQAMNPARGSPTAPRLADSAAAAGDALGLVGDVASLNAPGLIRRTIDGLRNRFDFNDAQAEAVVRAAVDPSQTQRMMAILADRMRPREFRNLSRAIRHQINATLQPSQPEALPQ